MNATESIRFECPHCEKRLRVVAKAAGRRVHCPKCAKLVTVPDESEAEEELSEPTGQRLLWPWFAGGGAAAVMLVGLAIWLIAGPKKQPAHADPPQVAAGPTSPSDPVRPDSRPEPRTKPEKPKDPENTEQPPKADKPDPAANDRDLKLVQGKWRPRKVYIPSDYGATEASAIFGGMITIDGKTFSQEAFDFKGSGGKTYLQKATIERIDAAKSPRQLDLKYENGPFAGKVVKTIYHVDDSTFEFLRCNPGLEPPAKFSLFGTTLFVAVEQGQEFVQCVRIK